MQHELVGVNLHLPDSQPKQGISQHYERRLSVAN